MELIAYKELNEMSYAIQYWRTKTGLEVDFILGDGDVAIEIKISDQIKSYQIKGLIAFSKEHRPKHAIVVSLDPNKRKIVVDDGTDILVLPWQEFLQMLWNKSII